MLLVLFLLLILFGFNSKQSIKGYDLLVIFFMAILILLAKNAPDFENYNTVYNYIGSGARYIDTGIGWYYICRLGNFFNLKYKYYSVVLYVVGCLMISNTVNRFIKGKRGRAIVWTFYLIFPALLDAVQIRFFVAEAVFLFACPLLLTKNAKSYIMYGIACLVSISIHTASIMYLIFLLTPILDKIRKYIMGFVITVSCVMVIFRNQIINIAYLFTNTARMERYFNYSDGIGPFGLAAYTFTLITFLYLGKIFFQTAIRTSVKSNRYFVVFSELTKLILLVFPLTLFDTNFFRIQRPLWFMLYIGIAILIENRVFLLKFGRLGAVKTEQVGILLACFGMIFYICAFTFVIVKIFLL